MLIRSDKFATLLVVILLITITSIGVASAQSSNKSLEEMTSMSLQDFEKAPIESAKVIINDYLTEIMQQKDSDGVALINYSIVNTDASDLNDIQVSVKLTYASRLDLPPVEYHVVRKGESYQVKKQFCAFDMIPDSPTRGTVRCNSNGTASV
ncbi:hypothetical protein [Paenibacillus montanisoli]|nr:hypothetical protein [Paenibacillus montanisoli]